MVVDALKVQFKMGSPSRTSSRPSEARLRRLHQDGRAARGPQVRGGARHAKLRRSSPTTSTSTTPRTRRCASSSSGTHRPRLAPRRVLRQPRGNAMLVGVGGSGKQLKRFAAYVAEMKCFQIELTKGYGSTSSARTSRSLLRRAGEDGAPVVFLFADTQSSGVFVEDINNILNSGGAQPLRQRRVGEDLSAIRPLPRSRIPRRRTTSRLFVAAPREPAHRARNVPRRIGRALPHVPLADQLLHD